MKSRLPTTTITIILMTLLVAGIAQVASAQDIVAGVKPGDEFTYTVTGSYSSDAPASNIPSEVYAAIATDHFTLRIVNVTGVEIGYAWSWYFNNGTAPMSSSGMLNIETTDNTGPFWAIYSTNLTPGQRIHPHYGPDLATFNETVHYLYTNYTRETNHLQVESQLQNNSTGAFKTVRTETYFDKIAGIMVKLNEQTYYQNPSFQTTITWTLSEQNVWTHNSPGSSPPEPFFTLPVIIAIAVVIAVLVILLVVWMSGRRRKARQKAILRKK
jgi:hypothetical protein